MPNPRIEPFDILTSDGTLTVLDPSDCTKEQRIDAANGYERGKDQWIALTDNPGFTQEDFCAQAGPDSMHPGHLLTDRPAMLMFVLKDGVGHGILSISNMLFEHENANLIEASGAGIYISGHPDTDQMLHESAIVCDYVLDEDIILKTGQTLDLLEWDLTWPDGLRTDKVIDLGPWFSIAKTAGVAFPALGPGEVIAKRIRRGDAPRQHPGDQRSERAPGRPPRPPRV